MKALKHLKDRITHEKWRIISLHSLQRAIRNDNGIICILNKPSKYPGQEQRYLDELLAVDSYAELISKAPDLLQLCEEMKEALRIAKIDGMSWQNRKSRIDSALNKYEEFMSSSVQQ